MKYWIIIDSWNLMETFVTESLSPHNFYESRNFGNDLTRFISKEGESYTDLVLYEKEPRSKYAIQIDDSILDKGSILPPSKPKKSKSKDIDFYYYPKTIYYRKGAVRFRFDSDVLRNAFIAESKIIIEVKTIEKYKDDFFVKDSSLLPHLRSGKSNSLGLNTSKYIEEDNFYNSLKGGIIAYACGVCTNTSTETQSLLVALTELKNNVAGLNTEIMLNGDKMPNFASSLALMAKVRIELTRRGASSSSVSSTFGVLKHILDEIRTISLQRNREILSSYTPEYEKEKSRLKKVEAEYQERLQNLEEKNLFALELRLQDIKDQEVENGKEVGKKRKYFKKGTKEYDEKIELKAKIKAFKSENAEYRELNAKLREIRNQLSDTGNETKYDATLSSLFVRFSDNINDIIKEVQGSSNNENNDINLSEISIKGNELSVEVNNVDETENKYFKMLANYLVQHPNGKQSVISDAAILNIIADTGKEFKNSEFANNEKGKVILDSLRQLWRYKNQQAESFAIPKGMPLLQAAMSFMIKPRGFDQIERFMRNRSYPSKQYSYMLLGLLTGFANIPKTLTATLYSNTSRNIEKKTEDYLFRLEKELFDTNK